MSEMLRQVARTAKTNAIAGASAGVAVGVVRGIVSLRRSRPRDRYDVAAEGLTHVGTGAVLGVLAAMTGALAGASVAAISGRSILAIAAPLVASTVATASAHEPVERIVRYWSEDVVESLRRSLERRADPNGTLRYPGAGGP